MRQAPVAASAVVLIALAALAMPAAAYTFSLNYSDPASDVAKLWSSNMTAVTNANGDPVMSPFPSSINILWIRSVESDGGASVNVSVEVQGDITDLDNTTYDVRLYTRADNASHFIVRYVNGTMTLDSNATGFNPADISGNHTITSAGPNPTLQNMLRMRVAKSLLGNITEWNLDATTSQTGTTYTYQDFGWEVPGNPGSTATQLEGLVTDAATNAPLAGVDVSTDVGGFSTTTSASGGYVLLVSPGTYNVTFRLDGYQVVRLEVSLTLGQTVPLNASLTRLTFVTPLGSWIWALIAIAAAGLIVVIAVVFLRRRDSLEMPPPPPPD